MTLKTRTICLAVLICTVAWVSRPAFGQWYGSVDCVAPARFTTHNAVFQWNESEIVQSNIPTGDYVVGNTALLDVDSLDMGFVAAVRATVGRHFGLYGIEGSYMRSNEWDCAASVFDPSGHMASPFSLAGNPVTPEFDNNYSASVAYQAQLESAELNLMSSVVQDYYNADVWLLLGVRWMQIGESLQFHQQNATAICDVSTAADNRLIGPQCGFNTVSPLPYGFLNLTLKGFVGFNAIRENIDYNGVALSDNDGSACLMGEAGIAYLVTPAPNIAVRVGYNIMGLSNIALASGNFEGIPATVQSGSVNVRREGVGYHLPYIGVILMY
jgi:hypothetical protein